MEQNYYNYPENSEEMQAQQMPQQTYQIPAQMPYQQQEPRRKKRNGKFATAAAIIAAVTLIGGSAGFGGAYIATSIASSGKNAASDSIKPTASYNAETGQSGNGNNNSDVAGAINALNKTDTNPTQKTSGNDVTATGENGAYTPEELYEAVNDAVVFVKIYQNTSSGSYNYYNEYFGYGKGTQEQESEPQYTGSGSGVIFTEDGYIITNSHVVEKAAKVTVEVNDYNDPEIVYEYEAKVIGRDASTDIAVLKIDRDEPFRAANIGNSDLLKVGQSVAAIGNPGYQNYLFKHTMTTGIVSGLGITCLADDGYSSTLIQTDTALNYGNSGGGLFDMYGNLVGIINKKLAITNYEGLGFAITINEVKPVIEDLLAYGYVKNRPMLGITTMPLNEYRAQLYGTKLSQGIMVTGIYENTPAAQSGLKVADIITKINGTNVSSLSDVQTILSKLKVGDTVTVTVARENSSGGVDSLDIPIVLTETRK